MSTRLCALVFMLIVTAAMPTAYAQSTTPPPATAEVKKEIISRCRNQMQQYGAAMVKACVDQDLEAFQDLQSYPKEYQQIIDRCSHTMKQYGYSMVKACADQDIEAEKALSHY
jgi:hypothetical protein